MRMIKRMLLACFAAVVLLCGCTQTRADALDPKDPVAVTLWHYYVSENQRALEEAVATFNQTVGVEHGVIVDAVAMGSIAELEQAVTESAMGVINAAPMPDLFSSYPDKAMEIDALDMLVDLSEYFTDEEKSRYVADFLKDGTFAGDRLLALPVVKSTELLYVNKTAWDAFAAATGADTAALETWEGLYETARAYHQWTNAQTAAVGDGRALLGFDSLANYVILGNKQLGVDVIDAESGEMGAAVLDKAVLRRVFDIYCGGIALGYFEAVGQFRSDDIKTGDLIAYVGSSSSAAYFPTWIEQDNEKREIAFIGMPYPVFEGGEAYAIQQGAGMCVAKSTPKKQAGAVLFLKWFTQVDQNIPFAMTTGYLPVQQAAYEDPAFDEALDALRAGDVARQNVAEVYEIALYQISEANTYAAKPFTGSYEVRSVLQSSLLAAAEDARQQVAQLRGQGMKEEALLAALDMDARFEEWQREICAQLAGQGIVYQER